MQTILTVVQVFLSLGLIGLVLIQHGRGADAGAAFGSGASATVFGARGSGSFLSRATGILGALFFMTSMALAYYAAQGGKPEGLMDSVGDSVVIDTAAPPAPAPTSAEIPTVPGGPAAPAGSDVPAVPLAPSAAIEAPAATEAPIEQAPPKALDEAPASSVAPEAAVPAPEAPKPE
jgi:preprotein translocase subunit SecG